MAWIQADLDALDEKIKAAVRSLSKGDRSLTYASMDEMLRLRDTMQAALKVSAGGATRSTYGIFYKD